MRPEDQGWDEVNKFYINIRNFFKVLCKGLAVILFMVGVVALCVAIGKLSKRDNNVPDNIGVTNEDAYVSDAGHYTDDGYNRLYWFTLENNLNGDTYFVIKGADGGLYVEKVEKTITDIEEVKYEEEKE